MSEIIIHCTYIYIACPNIWLWNIFTGRSRSNELFWKIILNYCMESYNKMVIVGEMLFLDVYPSILCFHDDSIPNLVQMSRAPRFASRSFKIIHRWNVMLMNGPPGALSFSRERWGKPGERMGFSDFCALNLFLIKIFPGEGHPNFFYILCSPPQIINSRTLKKEIYCFWLSLPPPSLVLGQICFRLFGCFADRKALNSPNLHPMSWHWHP